MPIRNLLSKKTNTGGALPSQPDDVARFAVTQEGKLIYASDSFYTLSHIPSNKHKTLNLSSILSFIDTRHSLETLKPGIHRVRIRGHADIFNFYFDWLTTPDNMRCLIGSQVFATKPPSKAALKKFAAQIENARKNDNRTQSPQLGETDLHSFASMSKDAMLVLSRDGKILRGNTAFTEIFDKSLDFTSLFADDDKLYIRNTLRTLNFSSPSGHRQIIDFEAKMQIAGTDDEPRWMEWRLYQKDSYVYCIGHDVTNIKKHEKALIRREKQLGEAESIGRMGHWHWTVGEDRITWSEELYRIFGMDQNEFEPTLQNMNAVIHRRDIDRVNQAFQRAIIERNDYDMEFRIKRPDGETRYIRCEGRCALDPEEDVIALYGIMQDMTERILYERELKNAKDSAERAYAAKTQFLANMSHELRTPLNAIIGFSEMMQRQMLGPIGTDKYLEYINGIRESGGHLLDLISDILDMSKIEAGKYGLALEEMDVYKTLKMAAHMMEGRALESGIIINTEQIQNEKLFIVADRRALMQIMLNLLSNAVKFTNEGGDIVMECYERENYIAIKVIDNGIGIPANKLKQVTRPFEQVSTSYAREHNGSGLGLAITKELTEMHGGALRIESTVGKGTIATVRLPYDAFKATQK